MENQTPDPTTELLRLAQALQSDVAQLLRLCELPRLDAKLLLTRSEAANALSMGLTFFEQHVQPEIALVRRGRSRLVPVSEVERWATANADRFR